MAESEEPPIDDAPEPVLDVIAMANGFIQGAAKPVDGADDDATAAIAPDGDLAAGGSTKRAPKPAKEPKPVKEPKPAKQPKAAKPKSGKPASGAPLPTVGPDIAPPKRHRRRTWPQRGLLVLNVLVILACFAGAAGLIIGRNVGNSLAKVDIVSPSGTTIPSTSTELLGTGETLPAGQTTVLITAPPETFPAADPTAQNFLITGADNNACIDPDSPYAAAFGNRESMGERSDTVMVMRVDPSTKRGAILSFPRDLWVKIPGRGTSRINSAYVKDDPQRLIDTIYQNFGVAVDHFIQIDFCAFRTIVDSIDGGVGVPFLFPARDTHTGLFVPEPGCYYFNGDSALAYVRSRHYQYYNDKGKWKEDPASDLSRISRQQDFIRRVLTSALNQGLINPSVARGLIEAAQNNVVTDTGLTLSKMLEFVGVLRDIQPGGIATYQIEATGKTIQGNAVLVPKINGDNMQQILRIFRGEAALAEAPQQVFETTTTLAPVTTVAPSTEAPTTVRPTTTSRPTGTSTGGTSSGTGSSVATTTTSTTTTTTTTTTTAPPVVTEPAPEEIIKGIVPPRDVTCP